MRRELAILCLAAVLVALCPASAWATVLVVQTADAWSGTQPADALTTLGIPYNQIAHTAFAAHDLSTYDAMVLQGSDGQSDEYRAYVLTQMAKVESFVNAGGLAIIHFADLDSHLSPLTMGPLGLQRTYRLTETGTILAGKETDPLFAGLTDADLDNWGYTAHGYMHNLPAATEVLVVDHAGDPIYVRYPHGSGEVWVTTMTLEWYKAPSRMITNEMGLAGEWQADVIPEPATLSLLGLGGLALLRRRRRN